jgi:uncharacterized membrane protein
MLWKGDRIRRRDLVFLAVLATALAAALLLIPSEWFLGRGISGPRTPIVANTERIRATVLEVDDSSVRQFGMIKTGDQGVTARVDAGTYAGEVVDANNPLIGDMGLDKIFAPGDRALLTLSFHPDTGALIDAVAVDHYRVGIERTLCIVFVLLLLLFAGWTGAKAMFSFLFAAVLIWKVLLPAFLAGWNPILTAFAVVSVLTLVIIFLVGGLTLRGLVGVLGSMTGVGLTAVLAVAFGHLMKLHGAVRPFAETLLYSGYGHLDLTSIFIAGIFLASSGAVMDIGMDIAASMAEVRAKRPDIGFIDLVGSGMTVGRAVIGTMTTTLLLAYSGGYTTLLMVFMAQGTPAINVLNFNYVAAEILHTLVGTFGLVLVAPATALIGGAVYTRLGSSARLAAARAVGAVNNPQTSQGRFSSTK